MITRATIADHLADYLAHHLTLADLVDWAEGVMMEEEFDLPVPCILRVFPMDFSGSPTVTLPCGFTDDGLPLGLQLVGRHGEEDTIMQAAHAYEQATEWHTKQPEV